MQTKTRDMTMGRPLGLILSFALPLMLGNMLHQVYSMADTAIVGQFLGLDPLAALGSCDWPLFMVASMVQGFAHGFSIHISQKFGERDMPGVQKAIAQSTLLSIVISVGVAILASLLSRWLLHTIHTPEDIFQDAFTYMIILFWAIPINMGYNLLAAILRSLGDSRTPLLAMIVASVINIGLDLLFIIQFHWGVAGAAIATALGQLSSFLFCLFVMYRSRMFKLTREDFQLDKPLLGQLLKLGAPVSLQNGIIGVGGMVVQGVINGFGIVLIAGFVATNKLYGLLEIAATSFGYAVSTFTGQNYGAGKIDRIKWGTRTAMILSLIVSALIGAVMIIFGRNVLSLFIASDAANAVAVMNIAYSYLCIMGSCLPILYLLYVYRSALQGLGDTFVPMLSGIVELIMRVGAALILPIFLGEFGLYWAETLAWLGAELLLMFAYYKRVRLMGTI